MPKWLQNIYIVCQSDYETFFHEQIIGLEFNQFLRVSISQVKPFAT